MIKLEKVNKFFKNLQVLKNITTEIHKGEIISLIGPSGCGKSTFLRCINGLEKVTSGNIYINGVDITDPNVNINKIREEVGIVFQQYNLFPHMTVKENIMLAPVKVKKMSLNQANIQAMQLLEKVGLIDKMDKYPDELSGGQAQRVAIARCLAMQPEILLFDEPTSALDPQMTNEVLDTMKSLAQEGMTMIVVTHEMSLAKEIANRIIFLYHGEILEEGIPQKIFESPEKQKTKEFLNNIVRLNV